MSGMQGILLCRNGREKSIKTTAMTSTQYMLARGELKRSKAHSSLAKEGLLNWPYWPERVNLNLVMSMQCCAVVSWSCRGKRHKNAFDMFSCAWLCITSSLKHLHICFAFCAKLVYVVSGSLIGHSIITVLCYALFATP